MVSVSVRVRDAFREWSDEFYGSVWPRFQVLVFATILCVGRHTVCRLLRIAGALAKGLWSSYHRVLSKRRWSTWRRGGPASCLELAGLRINKMPHPHLPIQPKG